MAYIAMKTHPNKQLMYDLRGVAAGVSQFVNIYKKFPGLLGAAGDGGVLLHLLLADLAHLLRPHGAVYIYIAKYIFQIAKYIFKISKYICRIYQMKYSQIKIYIFPLYLPKLKYVFVLCVLCFLCGSQRS